MPPERAPSPATPASAVFALALALALVGCSGGGRRAASTASTAMLPSSAASVPTTVATTTTVAPALPTPPPPTLPAEPREIAAGDAGRALVALTFDCGASAAPTPAILDALRAANLRVTFFLTGRWVDQNPDLTRAIAAEHEIANHTYSHGDLTGMSDQEIVDEMQRAEAVIETVTGRATKPLWRAPYGARDARVLDVVADAGWHLHVLWTADTLDWQDITPEQVLTNVRAKVGNGAIVLQHCGSPQTAAVLADEIRELTDAGFTLVTVSELLQG